MIANVVRRPIRYITLRYEAVLGIRRTELPEIYLLDGNCVSGDSRSCTRDGAAVREGATVHWKVNHRRDR